MGKETAQPHNLISISKPLGNASKPDIGVRKNCAPNFTKENPAGLCGHWMSNLLLIKNKNRREVPPQKGLVGSISPVQQLDVRQLTCPTKLQKSALVP